MSIAPSYWKYHGRPVRIVRTEDGGMTVERLDPETGEWERRLGILSAILGGDPDADELTEEDFDRWLAALHSGAGEDEAWEQVVASSLSLVEGPVEAIREGELSVRGRWWTTEGGLLPSVRPGDWVQLRIDGQTASLTELRPARR
jgi:hypothetical protein